MSAAEQGRVFLAMALCGALCVAAYDAARALLGAIGGGKVLCALADLSFGVLCAAGMTMTALALETDPFRAFEFGGLSLGIALYALTIGTFVRIIYKRIGNLMKKSEEMRRLSQNDAGKREKKTNISHDILSVSEE